MWRKMQKHKGFILKREQSLQRPSVVIVENPPPCSSKGQNPTLLPLTQSQAAALFNKNKPNNSTILFSWWRLFYLHRCLRCLRCGSAPSWWGGWALLQVTLRRNNFLLDSEQRSTVGNYKYSKISRPATKRARTSVNKGWKLVVMATACLNQWEFSLRVSVTYIWWIFWTEVKEESESKNLIKT